LSHPRSEPPTLESIFEQNAESIDPRRALQKVRAMQQNLLQSAHERGKSEEAEGIIGEQAT
jgi:hypothetical protein